MRFISFFNNKGGVGKTTLTYHTACALAELGNNVLLVDLDPQSNLTLFGCSIEFLDQIWSVEEDFISDYENALSKSSDFGVIKDNPRSIHFLVKPVEDGLSDKTTYSPPIHLRENLSMIPGRLSLHMFEDKIAGRWSDAYRGDPQAIRTLTQLRQLSEYYSRNYGFDYVLADTSPSLGMLNRVVISTADGFVVPCGPDLFSLYGIKNIGRALEYWKKEFDTLYMILSEEKRSYFPDEFVRFLGFTIYNAKKYGGGRNPYDLAQAAFHYAQQIPDTIREFIPTSTRENLSQTQVESPIGGTSVIHTHNTLPQMAQKYQMPMWAVPSEASLEEGDSGTVRGNRADYEETRDKYLNFARDLIERF